MMSFVIAYKAAIDKITADKALKLRKYELDNDDWIIIEDLVSVLEVRYSLYKLRYTTDHPFASRPTKKLHSFSRKIRPASQQ
jgi:hypothetical protein